MDFGFLMAANSITSKYLDQNTIGNNPVNNLSDEEKKEFGQRFEEAYDSLLATKMLSENMAKSYQNKQDNDFYQHASRLGYSIDNRVIDMLHVQLSDNMANKVNEAIKNTEI